MGRQRVRARRTAHGRGPALALWAGLTGLAGPAAAVTAPAELPPWEPSVAVPGPAPSAAAPAGIEAAPAAPSEPPATPSEAGPGEGRVTRPIAQDAQLPPLPRDPNDAPFMAPPNNQIGGRPPRTSPDIRRGWSARRRFAVTVAPAFASLRLGFQNRPANGRVHGGGLDLEVDAQLHRWIWLRAQGTYSAHRVDELRVMTDAGDVVLSAPRGTIHTTGFGMGPVFALDLGRFLPLIEVGLGAMRVATPMGVATGQRGTACSTGGACDVGLRCTASNVCEPTLLPDLYFGAAVDVMIRRHVTVGGQFRYYALLPAWSKFPVYLLGTVRLGVRF